VLLVSGTGHAGDCPPPCAFTEHSRPCSCRYAATKKHAPQLALI